MMLTYDKTPGHKGKSHHGQNPVEELFQSNPTSWCLHSKRFNSGSNVNSIEVELWSYFGGSNSCSLLLPANLPFSACSCLVCARWSRSSWPSPPCRRPSWPTSASGRRWGSRWQRGRCSSAPPQRPTSSCSSGWAAPARRAGCTGASPAQASARFPARTSGWEVWWWYWLIKAWHSNDKDESDSDVDYLEVALCGACWTETSESFCRGVEGKRALRLSVDGHTEIPHQSCGSTSWSASWRRQVHRAWTGSGLW